MSIKQVAILGAETQQIFLEILYNKCGVKNVRSKDFKNVRFEDKAFIRVDKVEQLLGITFDYFYVADYNRAALLTAFIHRNPNAIKINKGLTFDEGLTESLQKGGSSWRGL